MIKLLAVGDMHLGRLPSRLPHALVERAVELGPSEAWKRVIEAATEFEVDAVILAGDVVHSENDFFEAYRNLSSGVEQLTEAGIRVLCVAGNHDVSVLPRLSRHIKAFKLLGEDGNWESVELEFESEYLTLWGWSFPRARMAESPLRGTGFERGPGINLGIMHCDRDKARSNYAPVSSTELNNAGLDGWLLGHIHQPDELTTPHPSGYLGPITGLDKGEYGARGPWLIKIDRGHIQEVEQLILAPLRWERLEVDVEGISNVEDSRDRLQIKLIELDNELSVLYKPPKAVGLRVVFVGHSRFSDSIEPFFSEDEKENIYPGRDGTHYFIEYLENEILPEIRLEEIATRNDPPGLLAKRLLLLDLNSSNHERQVLIENAKQRLINQSQNTQWNRLEMEIPDDDVTVKWLRRSGIRLLDKLLSQQEVE